MGHRVYDKCHVMSLATARTASDPASVLQAAIYSPLLRRVVVRHMGRCSAFR